MPCIEPPVPRPLPACSPLLERLTRRVGRVTPAAAWLVAVALVAPLAGLAQTPADRDAPLTFDAAQMRIDGKRGVRVLTGGVEITRGTFSIKANEVELRDAPRGNVATALGTAAQAAVFQQRRPALDELIEGRADRIEYDSATEMVRLIGHATLKRWRAGALAEEANGALVVYDRQRETLEMHGGSGESRVRGVVTPVGRSGDGR